MNNSKIVIDNLNMTTEASLDITARLRERENELVKIIEAITSLDDSWKQVSSLVFKPLVDKLERELKIESEKDDLNTSKIYKLQGKLEIARKYDELNLTNFKTELVNVRKQLKLI